MRSLSCSSRCTPHRTWSSAWQAPGAALVQGNRQLLAQMLTNLIENGLKYVPAGGRVAVSAARHGAVVVLSVADNGPGIPAEERARAAQPFVRFAASTPQEGSGLGLSLVAAIVRLHRGRLVLRGQCARTQGDHRVACVAGARGGAWRMRSHRLGLAVLHELAARGALSFFASACWLQALSELCLSGVAEG